MKHDIRRAIDANLDNLRVSPASRQKILNNIQGGIPVKKKMSVAMAMALTLLLMTAVAVAAVLLTGKDVVEEKIVPLSRQSESERFTKAEVEEVLAFAEKHGVTLDEENLKRLRREDGYYKEELAMLFAKKDWGFYPGTWDVADQHWFGEFWIKIGGSNYNSNTIPREGELSQEEIEQIAMDTVREHTGKDYPLADRERYRLFRTFQETRHNPWQVERSWYLAYEALDIDLPGFSLYLTPQGEVTDYADNEAALAESDPATRSMLLMNKYENLYSDRYGSWDAWPQEAWQGLHEDLVEIKLDPKVDIPRVLRYVRQLGYGPSPQDAVSRDMAIGAAAKAVSDKYGVAEHTLLTEPEDYKNYGQYVYALYITHEGKAIWKVSFDRNYLAEVDAASGEVLLVDEYSPGNDGNRRYVPDALLPAERRAYATKAPPPSTHAPDPNPTAYPQADTRLAPTYFWEALQAINYNGDTAGLLLNEMWRDYGTDQRFWPLEMQAIFAYRDRMPGSGDLLNGLPGPDDITREEALSLARTAMNQEQAGHYEQEYLDSLQPAVQFLFNSPDDGDHTWFITFVDVSGIPSLDIATAEVDAKAGAVRDIAFPWLEEHAPPQPAIDMTLDPLGEDGRPAIWRSGQYPDEYWQRMEARGDTAQSVTDYVTRMQEEYGNTLFLWPVEAQAVYALWFSHTLANAETSYELPGLPGPDDMPEEQVLSIAWDAFLKESEGIYTKADIKNARPGITFIFSEQFPKGRIWRVQYADARFEYSTLGYIELDPEDGTILRIEVNPSNG